MKAFVWSVAMTDTSNTVSDSVAPLHMQISKSLSRVPVESKTCPHPICGFSDYFYSKNSGKCACKTQPLRPPGNFQTSPVI
jgi:hypothetical protein